MSPIDGELVRKVLEGDSSAFAELYRRRGRLVLACCRDVTGDPHLAADLAQEAFLRAYEKLDRLESPERFGLWVVGIARRVSREWLRGQTRRRHHLEHYRRVRGPSAAEPEREPSRRRLREAIARLPEKDRILIHSFYLGQGSVEEAIELLGVSRSTLYRLLGRARDRLRTILETLEVPS